MPWLTGVNGTLFFLEFLSLFRFGEFYRGSSVDLSSGLRPDPGIWRQFLQLGVSKLSRDKYILCSYEFVEICIVWTFGSVSYQLTYKGIATVPRPHLVCFCGCTHRAFSFGTRSEDRRTSGLDKYCKSPSLQPIYRLSQAGDTSLCSEFKTYFPDMNVPDNHIQLENQTGDVDVQQLLTSPKPERSGETGLEPLIPPALRLPPDIIEGIFLYCFRNGMISTSFPPKAITTTSLHFGHICKSWRTVALSIPHIWASLTINLDLMPNHDVCDLVETWFSRSGERIPLSITCSSTSDYPDLMMTILKYAHRWKHIDLVIPLSSLRNFKRRTSDHLFETLETLVLRCASCIPVGYIPFFTGAPRLRTLLFPIEAPFDETRIPPHILCRGVPRGIPDFQWHQITRFVSAHSFTPKETLEFFSKCHNLVDCSIMIDHENGYYNPQSFGLPPSKRIELRSLRKLQIRTWVEPGCLFSNLELPALNDFELSGPTMFFAELLVRMIKVSRCSLKRFCISDLITWPDEIVQVLREMPDLLELELSSPNEKTFKEYLDRDALLQLTDNGLSPEGLLLPQLEVLKLGDLWNSSSTPLVDMFHSRWELDREGGGVKQSARLRRVELELIDQVNPVRKKVMERLAHMEAQGLEVSRVISRKSPFADWTLDRDFGYDGDDTAIYS